MERVADASLRRVAETQSAGQNWRILEADAAQRFGRDVHGLRICNGRTGLIRHAPFWFMNPEIVTS